MLTAIAVLLLAPADQIRFAEARAERIAPPPPIADPAPAIYTPTSRVRAWTRKQRRCEKRRESACVMSAPDMVSGDIRAREGR